MSGYTPVFDTVYHGTLCGKWPTLPVWLTILPMADKNGEINMSHQAISVLTGWPIDLLKTALETLCAPDPESRSPESDGRRLELVDPDNRSWGWRVVNHVKYREKARKQTSDAARVADGRNAERMAERRGPATTRANPPSYSDTNTNPDSNLRSNSAGESVPRRTFEKIKDLYPAGTYRANSWLQAEREIGFRFDEGAPPAELVAAAADYAMQQQALGKIGSQFVLSPAKFFGPEGHWRGPFPAPAKPLTAMERIYAATGGDDSKVIEHDEPRRITG